MVQHSMWGSGSTDVVAIGRVRVNDCLTTIRARKERTLAMNHHRVTVVAAVSGH